MSTFHLSFGKYQLIQINHVVQKQLHVSTIWHAILSLISLQKIRKDNLCDEQWLIDGKMTLMSFGKN